MKVITLIENTSTTPNLSSEHGLSLYIETQEKKILFDMGQSELFAKNANSLGIDLSKVDYAIVSHGHYDHGGGLKHFLQTNKKATIFLQQKAFEKHYNNFGNSIGLDETLQNNNRIVFVEDYLEITSGIELFSCNNQPPFLQKQPSGSIQSDNFYHEIYLRVNETKSTVFSGCSHKNIVNIVHWLKPQILVGGFHFKGIDCITQQGELNFWAEQLNTCIKDFGTEFYTCHCTGILQYQLLKNKLGSKLNYIATGSTLCL